MTESALAPADSQEMRHALGRLDGISRAAMAAVLGPALPADEPGLAAALRVAPRHRGLLRRWLAALCTAGLLRSDPDGVLHRSGSTTAPEVAELADSYAQLGFPPEMARFHRAALARLPELLSDRITAQELLFAETDVLAALGAYQRNLFTGRLHAQCAELVLDAVRGHPGRPRVVELGGGTGATTEAVLAALAGESAESAESAELAEYVFTDVSPLYTGAATERFGVTSAQLDIDTDFAAQGFAAGGADVVVLGNVLHNATDIAASLRRIHRLLAPGGTLLLLDSVRATDAVLTSMAFLLSPQPGTPYAAEPRQRFTDQRAGTDTVFLSAEEWRAELDAAGFAVRAQLPSDDSPYAAAGQYLWHAVAAPPRVADAAPNATLERALADRGRETVCSVEGMDYPAAAVLAAVSSGAGTDLPPPARRFFAELAGARRAAEQPGYGDGEGDGEPPRTAVLADDPVGAHAALEAWAAGGHVTVAAPDIPPARLLALLEREGITEAVLPLAAVRAVPDAPSAAVTDLSALARVRCCEPGVTAADIAAWAALGPALEKTSAAHVPFGPSGQTADAAAHAGAVGDAALRDVDLGAAVAAIHTVGRAALHSMLNALYRSGCFTREGDVHTTEGILAATGTAPAHHRLLRRWLVVLTHEGLLALDAAEGFRCTVPVAAYGDLDRVWGPAWQQWHAAYGAVGTVEYAQRCAQELPTLLRGDRQAAELLFPQGRVDLARTLYAESVTARYQHHAAAALVAQELRGGSHSGPLRVLEAGGGTGTTTEIVLPELARLTGEPSVTYTFTDISPFFLGHAQERFGNRITYGLLDIDKDPLAQGYAADSCDVVVAGGVLNAAADTDCSVRGLARLLAPGGLLVLTEPTREEYWVLASQAFLMTPPQDARAATGASFLTHAQWRSVLDDAGLLPVADLPEPGHPLEALGHRVFAARKPPTT
ncbi:methyltransferase [Streptomyces sp. 8N114]|uniref:methyltransferase n=1 Tax=Streptomyces sp. 8N114 TaxID=3457419 RepID=UPI003FD3D9A3